MEIKSDILVTNTEDSSEIWNENNTDELMKEYNRLLSQEKEYTLKIQEYKQLFQDILKLQALNDPS